MSNLNDKNLDDLLRRAAEKYPLRTDSANFAKVVADLEKDPSLILPPLNNEDRRRRRRFIWLFLLLPLGGGAYFAWHAAAGRVHTEIAKGGTEALAGKTGNGEAGKMGNGEAGKTGNEEVGKTENGEAKKVQNGGAAKTENGEVKKVQDGGAAKTENGVAGKVQDDGAARAKDGTAREVQDGGAARAHDGKVGKVQDGGAGRTADGKAGRIENGKVKEAGDGVVGKEANGRAAKTENKGVGKGGDGNIVKSEDKGDVAVKDGKVVKGGNGVINETGNRVTTENLSAVSHRRVDGKLSLAATKGTVNVNIPVKGKTADAVQSNAPQKDKIKLQKPKPSFYVGILGSPDLSTIRMQSVKSVGYNLGVLLGYSFNSRWAIETGLYYDRKKYYTDGEYFSKEKLPSWFSNYYVKSVDGFCNMWEIPLNVRYNFPGGDKMKWFATGGFSNYLMTGETYTFKGSSSSNPNWHQTWPYKTPYKYWFSILDFSAGFEQRLGKIGNLRLEPYLRVPLSGIGTGKLSIMSAGLNIGITRRIW